MRSTPVWLGFPSPAVALFNYSERCIIPVINRALIITSNDDDHCEALVERQEVTGKNYNTLSNYNSILIRSNAAGKCEDSGPPTHGTIIDKGDHNHNDWSYRVWVMKTGWLITRSSKHMKAIPIRAEQYLRDQLSMDIKADTLEDLLRHCSNNLDRIKTTTPMQKQVIIDKHVQCQLWGQQIHL